MFKLRIVSVLLCALALSACAGGKWAWEPMECVPYARGASGIEIYGDAYTWWDKAEPQYAKGKIPLPGSVLVLAKTKRLQYGHVAVVKRVVGPREIEVAHTNWGQDYGTRVKVWDSMLVKDVSAKNDWSQLKFWLPGSGGFGRTYQAKGFIYNKPSKTIASLERAPKR